MSKLETHWLTLSEVAAYLKVKESHLRSLVFRNEIPFHKVGKLLRFKKSEIDSWMEQPTKEREAV